jgi:hypothetical protein
VLLLLVLISNQCIFSQNINYFPYKKNSCFGFCDSNKNLIYPCVFEKAEFMMINIYSQKNEFPLFKVTNNNKIGLFDPLVGKIIIEAKYDKIYTFKKIIIVSLNNIISTFNYKGEFLQELGEIDPANNNSYIINDFFIHLIDNTSFFSIDNSTFHLIEVNNFKFLNDSIGTTKINDDIFFLKRINNKFLYLDSQPYKHVERFLVNYYLVVDKQNNIIFFNKNGNKNNNLYEILSTINFKYSTYTRDQSQNYFSLNNPEKMTEFIKKYKSSKDTNSFKNKLYIFNFISDVLSNRKNINGWFHNDNNELVYVEYFDTTIRTKFNKYYEMYDLNFLYSDSNKIGSLYKGHELIIEKFDFFSFFSDVISNSPIFIFDNMGMSYWRKNYYWAKDTFTNKIYLKSLLGKPKTDSNRYDSSYLIYIKDNKQTLILNFWQDTILKLSKHCGNVKRQNSESNKYIYTAYTIL